MFHEELSETERYRLTKEQVEFLQHGGAGFCGLETKDKDSAPSAWTNGVEKVFPQARFFHKCGWISSYALEVAYVEDRESGKRFIIVPVVAAGDESKPEKGQKLVGEMARVLSGWVRGK